MPHSCSAWKCTNRFTPETRSKGITFHRFPKDTVLRRQWEVALRRGLFSARPSSMLCSEHFKPEDFDRTGQTVRIRDGAVPSALSFPAHLQRPIAPRTRTSKTSKKAQAILPVDCSQPVQKPKPLPVPSGAKALSTDMPQIAEHSYALSSSPDDLRARLSDALARIETLEREKRNGEDRERRAKNMVCALMEDLRESKRMYKTLLSKGTAEAAGDLPSPCR